MLSELCEIELMSEYIPKQPAFSGCLGMDNKYGF